MFNKYGNWTVALFKSVRFYELTVMNVLCWRILTSARWFHNCSVYCRYGSCWNGLSGRHLACIPSCAFLPKFERYLVSVLCRMLAMVVDTEPMSTKPAPLYFQFPWVASRICLYLHLRCGTARLDFGSTVEVPDMMVYKFLSYVVSLFN